MDYDLQRLNLTVREHGRMLQENARAINQHRDILLKIEAQKMEEQQEKLTRVLAESNAKVFEKASAYTNIIILAGYAGGFTIWSSTKAQLGDKANIWVATLLGFSLLVFIGWEIFMMILRSRQFGKVRPLLTSEISPKDFFKKLEVLKNDEAKSTVWFTGIWSVILFLTIGPALAAIAILAFNFYAILIR